MGGTCRAMKQDQARSKETKVDLDAPSLAEESGDKPSAGLVSYYIK